MRKKILMYFIILAAAILAVIAKSICNEFCRFENEKIKRCRDV